MRTLDCIAVHGTHWGLLDDCLHYYGAMPKEQTPCPT